MACLVRGHKLLVMAIVLLVPLSLLLVRASAQLHSEHQDTYLPKIQLPSLQFPGLDDSCSGLQHGIAEVTTRLADAGCGDRARKLVEKKKSVKIAVRHRDSHPLHRKQSRVQRIEQALWRDSSRIQGINMKASGEAVRVASSESAEAPSPLFVGGKDSPPPFQSPSDGSPFPRTRTLPPSLHSNVQSGVTLGSGEYFTDVFIGTPPRHFSLIIDTGSDLTWVQCNPCKGCYEQEGPMFSPNSSSSYRALSCSESRCHLIYNLQDQPCLPKNPHGCRYRYWYGDRSNTTGDLALETFALNLTNGQPFYLEDIVFGCGHANEGLFHGAGGLMGLGKGPLSFASQLRERYGRKFSYCLEDRNDNMSVSSILTFGEDQVLASHPDLQYTRFVQNTTVETFYYVSIEKITVGDQDLAIPPTTLAIDSQGRGGSIIDSGTTLTYFTKPVYELISKAFVSQIPYPRAQESLLDLCYDVSGVSPVKFPDFSITFKDAAVFKPPVQNYFLEMDTSLHTICLAMLDAPAGSLSILGNLLQQNIHFLYDIQNTRLGFANMVCSVK